MSIQQKFNLTRIINTRGTFTPLGVSRSSHKVSSAVAEALSSYFIIDELQDVASEVIASFAHSEAGTVTHCTAAGITLSVAATMAGSIPEHIASLPDSTGMPNAVVIPAGHCVNYGHPLEQAIRLAGAKPILAGTQQLCTLEDIAQQISTKETCCLLLVSSKLVQGSSVDLTKAVEIAHKYDVPTIIDGAAQDFRIEELVNTNADLILVSAQKYLASPTAGLVIGRRNLVNAVRAQEKGIGPGMKATKESIIGVLAAIEERKGLDVLEWQYSQVQKVSDFIERTNTYTGVEARAESDTTGLPFSRVKLSINSEKAPLDAKELVDQLRVGEPSIWVMDQNVERGELILELVQVESDEIDSILARLSSLLDQNHGVA